MIKVYEAKKEPCKVCNERDSVLLPIVNIDDKLQWYPVCVECRDKVPYPVIPVVSVLGEGYFYCPYQPNLELAPVVSDGNSNPILTRYSKKLLEQKV